MDFFTKRNIGIPRVFQSSDCTAYNLGFAAFFLFERYNVGIKAFDKLGELGFTFFLGASIPIYIIRCIEPNVMNWNCYVFCSIKFVLAVALSYVITR